ncbi:MAG: hypothetical protein KDH96_06480, partial [Candidatus Riesia sp.]|nr:hypothetical protein [Candidatus Riesia sp.]
VYMTVNSEDNLFFNENHISETILKSFKNLPPHLIESNNYFQNEGLAKTIETAIEVKTGVNFVYVKNNVIEPIVIVLTFKLARIEKPYIYENDKHIPMLPSHAIKRSLTYGINVYVTANIDIKIGDEKHKSFSFPDIYVGVIPIMCGSMYCNLRNIQKKYWKEYSIPEKCIGMFIYEGHLYSMICKKEMMFGKLYTSVIRIKKDDATIMHKYDLKGQILSSSTAENIKSTHMEMLCETSTGNIPSLNCEWHVEYFDGIYMPFYVFFYFMGVYTDYEITKYIVRSYMSKTEIALHDVLTKIYSTNNSMHGHSRESSMWKSVHQYLIDNDKNKQILHRSINISDLTLDYVKQMINDRFLNQVGTTTDDLQTKRIFFGNLVREMLIKYNKLRNISNEKMAHEIGESDRAEMINSIVHLPHDIQRKLFIRSFHKNFIHQIRTAIESTANTVKSLDELVNTDFSLMFKKFKHVSSENSTGFSMAMRTIVNQNNPGSNRANTPYVQDTGSNKSFYNTIEKKSAVQAFSTYNSTNKSRGLSDIQKTPPSAFGTAADGTTTAESDPGKRQGIPLTSTFTVPPPDSVVQNIKNKILEHKYVIPIKDVTDEMRQFSVYFTINFNNALFGITKNPCELKHDFINMRRNGEIYQDLRVFLDCDNMIIHFNCISGVAKSYAFIVYNNLDIVMKDGDASKFKQWINYDMKRDHDKNIKELMSEKIIEPRFHDDSIDIFVAPDQVTFDTYKNNITMQYTHLEIMSNLLAFISANIPFIGNSPLNRATFGGCHQLGAADISYPEISGDKKDMRMRRMNYSLAHRLTHNIVQPNVSMPYMAIAPNESAQEDGLTVNKCAVERGYMSALYFDKKSFLLTNGYSAQKPSSSNTSGMRSYYNYDKLDENGIIPVGTHVKENDVLMGITKSNVDIESGKSYIDSSVAYHGPNDALVIGRQYDSKIKDGTQISVLLKKDMPLRNGDKTATITANKAVVSNIVGEEKLFSTSHGITPTVLINPESVINRDIYNTQFLMIVSLLSLHDGVFYDASGFKSPLSLIKRKDIRQKLKRLTGNEDGTTLVYDNVTGDPINYVLMSPCDQLRIQKNGETELYAVGVASIDRQTKQASSGGRNVNGGQKISEMDKQVFDGQGISVIASQFQTDYLEDVICIKCNRDAISNVDRQTYYCTKCQSKENVFVSDSSFAIKEMQSRMIMGGGIGIFPILTRPAEIKGIIKKNGDLKIL